MPRTIPRGTVKNIPLPKAPFNPRKIKIPLLPRVQKLVEGKVIPPPVWYEAALAHPPPLSYKVGKSKELRFPEDDLREKFMRRNPSTTMQPKVLFVDDEEIPAAYRNHPADVFVEQQVERMKAGESEEEAYRSVLREQQKQERVLSMETEAARQQALAMGATPAAGDGTHKKKSAQTMMQQRLLRQFAEEARDQGLPYPRHWFDKNGEWRGIGAEQLQKLERTTRRSLGVGRDRSTTVVQEMLRDIDLGDLADGEDGGDGPKDDFLLRTE
mmetsp:Transcript_46554/g.101141  ORF Transcript_46554/g.101141 Transcript_46554/m.101141 type:complete len:270 (-) Transcript_46554:345-1154(-)